MERRDLKHQSLHQCKFSLQYIGQCCGQEKRGSLEGAVLNDSCPKIIWNRIGATSREVIVMNLILHFGQWK